MKNKKIDYLNFKISIPPSKSYTQRFLLAALLSNTYTKIENVGTSNDEIHCINILKYLKKNTNQTDNTLEINVENHDEQNENILEINFGESATALRLFSIPLINIYKNAIFNGTGTLLKRNNYELIELIELCGLKVNHQDGKLPIIVSGKIIYNNLCIKNPTSSQNISGLMFLYAFGIKDDSTYRINIENPVSIPYINMTIDVLRQFNCDINFYNNEIIIKKRKQSQDIFNTKVEADWSSASFFIVLAAIAGKGEFLNLNSNSLQADKYILEVINKFGAKIDFGKNLTVETNVNRSFEIDITNCPDLFPIVSILALFGDGVSTIYGIERLSNKESNRLDAICKNFEKLKVEFTLQQNAIKIQNGFTYDKFIYDSYNDHRIAMSFIILSLINNEIDLNLYDDCVNKSFPDFFNILKKIII